MIWPWSKKPSPEVPVTDVDEARALFAEASEAHRDAVIRGQAVTQLASYIQARREANHFGDAIQITFTRRGTNG